ncbi:FkbM family methyltransferase [Ohtaekwangia koreensis]|uniref:Methyltransferase, FkbM family n=1 Tax=Ohtaekwangia koreensis TaxID=688867 RepID=A0A1T5K753_9BACT|nr:FkbM family methyltransferase [Ohtaekwangia koreensis]SKC59454.1 methyltransferase, FkbM family [Ohtaekwangia koreensis]
MKYLKHLYKVISKTISSKYSYSKFELLYDYCRLVLRSIAFHKIGSSEKSSAKTGYILGYKISFSSYPQILHLVEEIFISQLYKYETSSSKPFIIDCGSNIGLAILYFKKVYPSCRIIGFEPDPATFKLLQENIHKNQLTNVTLHNVALNDKEEKTLLYKNSTSGLLTMSLIPSKDKTEKEAINTKKISDYIHETIDLIKIDVEGSEIKIIDDILRNGKSHLIKKMIIEYHPSILKIPIEKLITNLEEHHFTCGLSKDILYGDVDEVMIIARNESHDMTI